MVTIPLVAMLLSSLPSAEELQQSEPEESLTLLSLHPHSTVRLAQHSLMTPSYAHTHSHMHRGHTHTHTHTFQDYLSPVVPSGRGGAARTTVAPEESIQWSIWSVRPSYPGGVPRPVPPFSQSDPATSTLETLQLHHVRGFLSSFHSLESAKTYDG